MSFNVKGTSPHDGNTSGSVRDQRPFIICPNPTFKFCILTKLLQIEAKYADPPTGTFLNTLRVTVSSRFSNSHCTNFSIVLDPKRSAMLIFYRRAGLTLTQSWTTVNTLATKLELDNNIAKGLKAEALTDFVPSTQKFGAKLNLYFKQPNFHTRAFFDVLKGPQASVDAVLGHEGFLVGAEAGYDVQKAALTKYSAAIGFTSPEYSAAITASNSLSVFAASYYHKVNSQVEAGAKATWDSKGGDHVAMEVAGKYRLDPTSFAKVRNFSSFPTDGLIDAHNVGQSQ